MSGATRQPRPPPPFRVRDLLPPEDRLLPEDSRFGVDERGGEAFCRLGVEGLLRSTSRRGVVERLRST